MASDLGLLAEKCTEISDELADQDGFVTTKNLATRFDARIILRPLLVEAMLASSKSDAQEGNIITRHQWAVILDSETFPDVTENHILNEDAAHPLPARMRNTVAHELVHSFAFRSTDFGVRLTKRDNSKQSWDEFIEWIERETEKLSPFLLIPDKYLVLQLSDDKGPLTINSLKNMIWSMGVSRAVLVNRLRLLRLIDRQKLLDRKNLKNIAIGIGEWRDRNQPIFKEWPLFVNFDNNIVPEFILKLSDRKQPQLKSIFTDSSFLLYGGTEVVTTSTVRAGTLHTPDSQAMKITCEVESATWKPGEEFLFIVRAVI